MKNIFIILSVTSSLMLFLIACEKTEIDLDGITDPRQAACLNYGLGKVSEITQFKNEVWWDEFDDDYSGTKTLSNGTVVSKMPPGTDASCYSRNPTCLRRMDWNSPDTCLEQNYPSIAKLNKCVWNVGEGYFFWTDNSTTSLSPHQVEVSGGTLKVKINKNTSPNLKCGLNPNADPNGGNKWDLNCPIKIGGVNSKIFSTPYANTPGFNARHGRIEFRAKINPYQTSWPALWMWEQFDGPRLTEIDVMENSPDLGQYILRPYQTLHTWIGHPIPPEKKHYSSGSTHTAQFGEEYHIYGVERLGNRIKFYIDDCYTREIKNGDPDSKSEGGTLSVNNNPMFLIMGAGITKESINVIDQIQGDNMLVDWVRVYE